ncbi:hypothetical protein Lal_00040302 [Lupinus albus]|nr:hypothetical protein Lal_00040302 [Lupinus albus]
MANPPTTELERSMVASLGSNNIQNPYFLHPRGKTWVALVTPPLQGNNYHSWMRSMKRILLSKNKFMFVDGFITTPSHSNFEYDM